MLLIRKKSGFGAGKVNGIGGKVEPGETPEEAARREVLEEVGVRIVDVDNAGLLYFYSSGSEPDWIVHVFRAYSFEGRPLSTVEADPVWVPLKSIPFGEMWEDDRHWLPHVLAGYAVEGHFYFDENYSKLLKFELKVGKK